MRREATNEVNVLSPRPELPGVTVRETPSARPMAIAPGIRIRMLRKTRTRRRRCPRPWLEDGVQRRSRRRTGDENIPSRLWDSGDQGCCSRLTNVDQCRRCGAGVTDAVLEEASHG